MKTWLICVLIIGCTTVSQLQRTSNSACGNIVCPKELVQYECEVGSGIDTLVWRVSGCGNALEIVYQQGMDVQQAEGSCEDGQSITADLQQINASFFRSTLNITGVRSNLTIQCSSDDGSRESLIGMDKLISTGMLLACLDTKMAAGGMFTVSKNFLFHDYYS